MPQYLNRNSYQQLDISMAISYHVHFADELAAKGVNDTSHRGGFPLADEVEVQHALNSTRLKSTVQDVRIHRLLTPIPVQLTRQNIVSCRGTMRALIWDSVAYSAQRSAGFYHLQSLTEARKAQCRLSGHRSR